MPYHRPDCADGGASCSPASRVSTRCLVGSSSGPSRNIHSDSRTHCLTISGVVLNEAAVTATGGASFPGCIHGQTETADSNCCLVMPGWLVSSGKISV